MKRAWPDDARERSRLVAADLDAFLAAGRKIRVLPIGASGEEALIHRRFGPGRRAPGPGHFDVHPPRGA